MARPVAISKCLYYPTPLEMVDLIGKHVTIKRGWSNNPVSGKMIDPCCGEGTAVARLGKILSEKSGGEWIVQGVELDGARASEAMALLGEGNVAHAAIEQIDIASIRGQYDIVFLNPPYDTVGGKRIEPRFVSIAGALLSGSGLMIIIIPERLLIKERERDQLLVALREANLGNVKGFRFPEPYFDTFKQVVLFASKGGNYGRVVPTHDSLDVLGNVRDWDRYNNNERVMYIYTEPDRVKAPEIEIATNELPVLPFITDPENHVHLYNYMGDPTGGVMGGDFRPLAPMRDTLAAMVAASGMLNGVKILGKGGEQLVVRGSTSKRIVSVDTTEKATDGRPIKVQINREVPLIELSILSLDTGDIENINNLDNQEDFEAVMLAHSRTFVDASHELYPPVCDETTVEKWRGQLAQVKAPRALHGKENGLFEAQIERAAWLLEGYRHYHNLTLVGEMSTGKTVLSLAVAAVHASKRKPGNQHILIMLPPKESLIKKWAAESKKALRRFNGGKGPTVHICKRQTDLDEAFKEQGLNIILMKETMAKMGSGWRQALPKPRVREERVYTFKNQKRSQLGRWTWWDEDADDLLERMQNNGAIIEYSMAENGETLYSAYMTQEQSESRCFQCGQTLPEDFKPDRKKARCPICNTPFWQFTRRAANKSTTWQDTPQHERIAWAEQRAKELRKEGVTVDGQPIQFYHVLDQEKPNPSSAASPLARYIRNRYNNRYFLIIDECHRAKGGDTDIGYAFADLTSGSNKMLQMTGTIFGGISSSIFYLLYRTVSTFRETFAHSDRERFIDNYGFREQITKWYPPKVSEHSRSGGYSRYDGQPKETPGVAPAIAALLLPYTVFLSLEDLDHEMVGYSEHTLFVDTNDKMQAMYNFLDEAKSRALEAQKEGDGGPMGQYRMARQGTWNIPTSSDSAGGAFRDGINAKPGYLFPKEEALLRLAWQDKQEGRKMIVYTMQINRRDPTGRYLQLLEKYGMKGAVMRQNVKDRVQFVLDAIRDGADVIFCSPELVAEGVDLDMISTEVWLNANPNLYVVLQANRRAWRIPSEKDVRVIYLGYNGTPESDWMSRVARKMAAAQAVQGDLRSGLAHLLVEDDFVSRLQDSVTAFERVDSDLTVDDLPELPPLNGHGKTEAVKTNGRARAVRPSTATTKSPDFKFVKVVRRGKEIKNVQQGSFGW